MTATETEKHQRLVDAVCVWMGWTAVDRDGVRCWRHYVLAGEKGKRIELHDPVSSFDPWRFREDVYWVLQAVRDKGLASKLGKLWLADAEVIPESLALFAIAEPRDIMGLVGTLMK